MLPLNIVKDSLHTPCFVVEQSAFKRSIEGFQVALQHYFEKSIVSYSVKTNSLPWCLKEAGNLGCYAEVVSYDEYKLALLCGYEKNNIIYNGPMKSKETFLDAIQSDAIVNVECHRELEWLTCLPKNKRYKIGIRLNINISKISKLDANGDNDDSRFGFCVGSGEFEAVIKRIKTLENVDLVGLHIHRTSHQRRVEFYENSISYAVQVIKKYHLDLQYIDVGGGYFGIFANHPTYDDYAAGFYRILKQNNLEKLTVIVEPGNGLVASAFSFLSSVIDVKQVDDVRFITTDGSRNDVDPFFHKKDYMKTIFRKDGDRQNSPLQVIAGCTCLEYDRLFSLENQPELHVGDRILYHNVGAYTMALSPQFIRLWARVYSFDGKDYQEVRRASTADDIMITSI